MKKDVKMIFDWAKAHGDANIYDRILIKLMPELLKEDIKLTSELIENSQKIELPDGIYDLIVHKAEELVGAKYV